LILKLATESRALQEVYIDDEDVPPAGTRIFYIGLDDSIKGGILWGYDAKAVKSEKTVVYKDKLPIVNQSVFEAVKDAGEYYLYPALYTFSKDYSRYNV